MYQEPVFKSLDSGKTWTSLFAVLPSRSVTAFVIDPVTPANLYAGADGGLYKSSNGGASWTLVTAGLGTGSIRFFSLFINPLTPKILLCHDKSGCGEEHQWWALLGGDAGGGARLAAGD